MAMGVMSGGSSGESCSCLQLSWEIASLLAQCILLGSSFKNPCICKTKEACSAWQSCLPLMHGTQLQDLVINLDQTGIHFIPACGRGRARKGAKEVAMLGGEDKRQITGVLAVSASGKQLPPQLIFSR